MSEESQLDKEFDEFADSATEDSEELPEIDEPIVEPPATKPRRKRLAKKLQGDGSVGKPKKITSGFDTPYPFNGVWARRIEALEIDKEFLFAEMRKLAKWKLQIENAARHQQGAKVKRTRKKKVVRRTRKKVGAIAKRWKAFTKFFKRN